MNEVPGAGDEGVAVGEALGGPGSGQLRDAPDGLAFGVVLDDAAGVEMGDEEGSGGGEAGVAKLRVDLVGVAGGDLKLLDDVRVGDVHDDDLCGLAVLDKENVVSADGSGGAS
jgi:hypothetical protein